MKIIFTAFLIFHISTGFSQKDSSNLGSTKYWPATLVAIRDGEFMDPGTFGEKIPKPGDNIIIPRNVKVSISSEINFSNTTGDASTIYVGGVLMFKQQGKLKLSAGSVLYADHFSVIGGLNHSNISLLEIGNASYYGESDSTLHGPINFPSGVLPESFLNITTTYRNHSTLVSWSTIKEYKTKYFQLLRSTNGSQWELLSTIPASGGTNVIHTYLFKDETNQSPVCYYRIKIIDASGRGQYSFIRSSKIIESKDITSL